MVIRGMAIGFCHINVSFLTRNAILKHEGEACLAPTRENGLLKTAAVNTKAAAGINKVAKIAIL